jgi:hypothetical protein
MLKATINDTLDISVEGFLIAAEVEKGTDIEAIGNKLADALTFMEGIGQIEVNHLGALELVDEDHPDAMSLFESEGGKVKES